MRILAQGKYRLSAFSPSMKVSLTFFIVFLLLGLVTSIALAHQQTSFSAEQAQVYYLGNEDDLEATEFHVQKSYRQLLEVAHFHLYIMPVVYLAFIHLYFLSSRSEREKTILSVLTFSALLLEVAAPWLIRFVSPEFSTVFYISGLGIVVTTLWMSAICLREMWARPGE